MSSEENKSVAIILVTYNGVKWLRECLRRALEVEGDTHIFVIDNASTDDTVSIIKSFDSEKVTFIQSEYNLGFGRANNLGFEAALEANPDYFYLLNQDAYLEKDALSLLLEAHQKEPEYGILSPLHTDGTKEALDHRFIDYITRDDGLEYLSDLALARPPKNIYKTAFVNAAGWLISKICFQAVGGFNPVFSHYGEDNNYVDRLTYHKFQLGFVPAAKMAHDRNQVVKPHNIKDEISFQRQVLKRLSDPNDDAFTVWKFLKWHILKNYRPLLNPVSLLKRILYYYQMKKRAKPNRELSKVPGLTFLSVGQMD